MPFRGRRLRKWGKLNGVMRRVPGVYPLCLKLLTSAWLVKNRSTPPMDYVIIYEQGVTLSAATTQSVHFANEIFDSYFDAMSEEK